MSVYQMTLRVFSIIAIVMGGIVVAAGAVVIIAAFSVGMDPTSQASIAEALANQGLGDVNGSEVAYEVASMGVSVALWGGLFLATGIFGLIAAKDGHLTLPVVILSIVGLVVAMLNLVGGFVSGSFLLPGSGTTSLVTAGANVAIMAFLMALSLIVRAQSQYGE